MTVKFSKEELIKKARRVHGDKYDYSKVESSKMHDKVTIICPIHGEFKQEWRNHLKGGNCAKCSGKGRKNTEEFIKEYQAKFGTYYDMSKVKYVNATTKVCMICPEHGEFWISPHSLLNGVGCAKCAQEKKSKTLVCDQEEVIQRIKVIHGDKYDLSRVVYKGMLEKVELVCPLHGSFWIRPHNIIDGRQGCPKCGNIRKGEKSRLTTEEFIKRATKVHGGKYDYSKAKYVDRKTKVVITCHEIDPITGKEHGEFSQTPADHLNGCGCKKCSNKFDYTVDEYIEKANIIHNGKYDYSKLPTTFTNYSKEKIIVVCKTHGDFHIKPYLHLCGIGCPLCNESHLERDIYCFLNENTIKFVRQQKFDWLGLLSLDFYLPEYNIAIECQGRQHFEPIEYFGGEEGFKNILERDERKYKLCSEHEINILYYTDIERLEYPYEVIKNKEELIGELKKKGVLS